MRMITPRQRRLLNLLLNRFEAASSGRRPSITMTAERFPEYFADSEPVRVRQWEEEIRAVEALGWISLDWGRGADSHRLIRTRLNVDQATEIAGALGRMTADEFARSLDAAIAKCLQGDAPSWLRAFLGTERERWKVSRPPSAETRKEQLDEYRLIYLAVERLAANRERLTWRQFSVAHFSDSKRLLSLKPRICRILAAHALGQHQTEDPDEAAVLSHFGIDLKAGIVLMSGPARIEFPKSALKIDGDQWKPFLAVPEEMLAEFVLDVSDARAILTIENEESFHAFARSGAKPDWLTLYLGGFPSKQKLRLLRALRERGLPFHHWGDLDCGGIDIFLYLERELGIAIAPLGMEPERLRELDRSCRELAGGEIARLLRIRGELSPEHALCSLIDEMMRSGKKLEQEALLDPFRPPERSTGL